MVRGFLLGIVATLVVLAAAGYAVLKTGAVPANADARPGPVEKYVARASLRATLNNDAPKEPNPVPLTDANLIAGIKLYAANCVVCHGNAAGDKSASPIAKGEYPAPPQLGKDGVEDDPQGWTYWKIEHGIRWTGMPSWKHVLSPKEIWTLALFLKHMDKLPPGPEAAWKQVPAAAFAEPADAGTPSG